MLTVAVTKVFPSLTGASGQIRLAGRFTIQKKLSDKSILETILFSIYIVGQNYSPSM